MGLFKGINISANILKFVFAIVGVVLAALIMFKWDDKIENKSDIMPMVDGSMMMCWIALGICIGVAVLFGIYQFITNIKKNKGSLIGIIAFAGVLIVSFTALSKTKLLDYQSYRGGKFADPELNYNGLTDFWLKVSEGGMYAVYILVAVAVLAAVVAEVSKLVK